MSLEWGIGICRGNSAGGVCRGKCIRGGEEEEVRRKEGRREGGREGEGLSFEI